MSYLPNALCHKTDPVIGEVYTDVSLERAQFSRAKDSLRAPARTQANVNKMSEQFIVGTVHCGTASACTGPIVERTGF
jgi:hypothetical protein